MSIDVYLVFTYILAILLFLGTPGPVTVLVVNTSVKYGFKSGLATIIGTNTASLILIALSFVIIQGLFAVSEQALLWLTLFGSLYLFYFSINILKEKLNIEQTIQDKSIKASKHHFKDGFVIGLSNPKDILFFIAFFPMFFAVSNNNYLSMLILTGIWVVLDYVILSVYALLFSKITNYHMANIISKLSGLILFFVAVYMGYTTVMTLLG